MRATTAIFDVFSFAGAGITSKTIETMRLSRKSGPDLPARLLRIEISGHRLG
jgi:hypothetical protein